MTDEADERGARSVDDESDRSVDGDAGPDAAEDAGPDAAEDAGPDAAEDAGPDAAEGELDADEHRRLVREGYDALGDVYADQRSPSPEAVAAVEDLLDGLAPADRLLDAGCGRGSLVLERAEPTDVDAVGLDVARGQVRGAAEAAPAAALVQGDVAALPFDADAFDALTAFYSLIHVPIEDHDDAVAEFARVLRPGGTLLLTEGNERWTGTHDDWLGDGTAMTWDVAGIDATIDRLEAAGFAVRERVTLRDELADTEEEPPVPMVRAELVDAD